MDQRHYDRVDDLGLLLNLATTIGSATDIARVLEAACVGVVQLFGVSHSAVVMFEGDYGTVRAESPDLGAYGLRIALKGIPAEERLIALAAPVVLTETASAEAEALFGEVIKTLRRLDIRSIAIVPIVAKNVVIGSFSLDSIGRAREFSSREIELCQILATHIGVAVESAHLYTHARREAEKLELLRRSTLAMTTASEPAALHRAVVEGAVSLLTARNGGYYAYYAERDALPLLYELRTREHIGTTLRIGEGVAGRVVMGAPWYLAIPDYDRWEGKARVYDAAPFGSVLGAAVRHQERILGVLWVERDAGVRFTEDEIDLLLMYTDQVAVAISHMELGERLTLIAKANQEVLGSQDLQEGLHRLAALLVNETQHTFCRLLLLDDTGTYLIPKAAYPMPREADWEWRPGFNGPVPVADWPGAARALRSGEPTVLRSTDPPIVEALANVGQRLGLPSPLQSLLAVPLALGGREIGLVEIGEVRREGRSRFGQDTMDFVKAIAAGCSILIDRLRREAANDRRRALLTRLDEAQRHLRSEKDARKLASEIPGLAATLLDYEAAYLYVHYPRVGRMQLESRAGDSALPNEVVDSVARRVAASGEAVTEGVSAAAEGGERPAEGDASYAVGVRLRKPAT